MFAVTCSPCHQRYLVGTRAIRAFRNTPDGPAAVVACPAGHLVEHEFHTRAPRPAPAPTCAPV